MGLESSLRLGRRRLGKSEPFHSPCEIGMLTERSFIPPIMTNAALILLWCLFGILFWWKGKTFRRWSKNSSVHRMGSL
jgi:hypothetical protein